MPKSKKSSKDCRMKCAKQYPLSTHYKKCTNFYITQMAQLKSLCDEASVKNIFESYDEKLLQTTLPILRNVFTKLKTDMNTLQKIVLMDTYRNRIKCILASCMDNEQLIKLQCMAKMVRNMPPSFIMQMIHKKFIMIVSVLLQLPSITLNDINEQTLQDTVVKSKGVAHLQQQCRIYTILSLHMLLQELLPLCFTIVFPLLLVDE